jgi:DNA-binding HxlR family transcriptional regulator
MIQKLILSSFLMTIHGTLNKMLPQQLKQLKFHSLLVKKGGDNKIMQRSS